MSFYEQLNHYIEIVSCTTKELADYSELSPSVISRYRTGKRIPKLNSEQLIQLVEGIYSLANIKNISLVKSEILTNLTKSLNINQIDFELLRNNLNELIITLKISMVEMSRALNFDASYLSRIRNGNRKPADYNKFINDTCQFIILHYQTDKDKNAIANLINCSDNELNDNSLLFNKLQKWLCSNTKKSDNHIDEFLKKLDTFDLNQYIKSIHFDELKVFTIPIQFKTSKNYYGIEDMKQGELDFFKSTVLSKNKENVYMCSDMPMEDMAKDIDFGKKWMFAIAMCLKKGLQLNIIHNIDRPFNEMMLGLESWIPIYMTGQVLPYYLKKIPNNTYCHLNYVSGTVALAGECITGYHNKGKYYLTNNKDEVNYYKEKTKLLFSKAYPLIQIYRENNKDNYNNALLEYCKEPGSYYNILSSLPIYTISENLLLKILKRNSISVNDQKKILEYVKDKKKLVTSLLESSNITDEISNLSKDDFNKEKLSLSLSDLFYQKKIYYNYDEYLEHLKSTESFTKQKNYNLKNNNKQIFKNINIHIHNNCVIISKDSNPNIHFVINNPKLCNAIENFVAPIIE